MSSARDHVVLEADGPIMRAVMVGRKTEPGVTVLGTFVFYRRPVASILWTVVGVVHRRVAPYLLARVAETGQRSG